MRIPLHPAAWIGFLLNCLVAFFFMSAIAAIDPSLFSEDEQLMLGVLLEQADSLRVIFYVVLAMQAVALGMLATRVPFGLALACLGSVLMLPGSLLYLIGCLLSHYRNKYLDFTPAPSNYSGALFRFSSAFAPKMRITASVAIALSFLAVLTGWVNAAAVCFGVSIAAFYFAIRTRRMPPLTLFDKHLTLTPGLFASSLLIPYSSIRVATLMPNESIVFTVESEARERPLTWSLLSVAAPERREALEALGKILSENGVTLDQTD